MRNSWISITGLGVCSLLGVLLLSDPSWARPKKTNYVTCKCTCRAEDVLGGVHEGRPDALVFTEASATDCLKMTCKIGNLQGNARNCSVTEHSKSLTLPPGGVVPGVLQQTPTTSGEMGAPPTGTIKRRAVEGEQPAETAPDTSSPTK